MNDSEPSYVSCAFLGSLRLPVCPDGQISVSPVQPPSQKYSGSLLTQISSTSLAIPAHTQGAFRDRHGRRAGDAMDAACQGRMTLRADGEVVWS
jgi:hypothetical protein